MPHQCTNCERTFPDGSKEMLSGCPDCGGNKFQFVPAAAVDSSGGADPTAGEGSATDRADSPTRERADPDSLRTEDGFSEWPETARRPEDRQGSTSASGSPGGRSVDGDAGGDDTSRTGRGTSRADDSSTPPGDATRTEIEDTTPEEEAPRADAEDAAQADARSEFVPREELPDPPEPADDSPPSDGRVVSEPTGERPSMEELREELNDQFESIKIVNPGQYELNLMELYDREEYIVSLQEDGRYVIDVPDSWRQGE